MSLTDEIYLELLDGLEKGLDWQRFLAKYSTSKGPLYNAIGRLFTEVGPRIAALNEERKQVQEKLDQAELTLDSFTPKTREAESNIASLEDRENVLDEQVEAQEAKLAEMSELAMHLAELERLGFDSERLKQLQEALGEIGAKHGLRSKEAVSKFFEDLKDYGAVLGARLQLKGLQTQIETKKLEAENWQAKEEAFRRKHNDLKEDVGAVHALNARGIKTSQIITWNKVLSRFQTVEQFEQSLAQYGDMAKLLEAGKEEAQSYELRSANAQGQVEALEKKGAKIEGSIDALKVAGVRELKAMTEEATKQLKAVAAREIKEAQAVGQEVRREFNNYFTQLDSLTKRVFEIGQEFERKEEELQKYGGVKEVLDSHAQESEAGK